VVLNSPSKATVSVSTDDVVWTVVAGVTAAEAGVGTAVGPVKVAFTAALGVVSARSGASLTAEVGGTAG